jgi:putative Mg2+ transporter-C (MgtC) family protein
MDIDAVVLLRLVLSAVLGGIIGFEREIHGRPAGFRTHLLVSLGACVFTITSIYFSKYITHNTWNLLSGSFDPSRVAAQVVTGIGFLGAGAIIREKASVRGLTTAACLWVVAAVGTACGVGAYTVSIMVTLLAVGSLLVLKKVEGVLRRDAYSAVKVWSMDLDGQMVRLEKLVENFNMRILNACVERDIEKKEIFLEFEIKLTDREVAYQMIDTIVATSGVKKVRLE